MQTVRNLMLVAALLAAAPAHARNAPMVNFENIAISTSDGKAAAPEKVRKAIIQAASARKWAPSQHSPNTIRATYNHGSKYSAVVDIKFTGQSYSIVYVDSVGLNYASEGGKSVVHPTYNKLVTALRQSIDAQLRSL